MMASQTTLDEKIVQLENSKQIPQNSRPKIQRVQEYLRNRKNFEKHYSPKLVSIGPIHHDNTKLKTGEKYKLMWAKKYLENTSRNPRDLHKKIADKINELKGHFSDDVLTLTGKSLEGFGSLEEKLSWMLFLDGCSLLHILEKAKLHEPGQMNIKVDQLVLVMMDVLLLENQLPYEVLKLLWKDDDESELIMTMKNFLKCHHWATPDNKRNRRNRRNQETSNIVTEKKGKEQHSVLITNESETPSIPNESQSETIPTHLLDLQRNIILVTPKIKNNEAKKENWSSDEKVKMMTYRNIQDLKAVGIRLKSSKTRRPQDIDFSEGLFAAELTLPEIVVDDTSAATFLNLIAYEMCPDFDNDYGICSFAAFMDSLIDNPEDVKVLRSKGILLNSLGSDEEVAELFNIISTDLVPNSETYFGVRAKIHDHYCNRCNTWIAEGYHTYFSNPWAIIAFIAAFTALVLTFIQTWFAMNPAC